MYLEVRCWHEVNRDIIFENNRRLNSEIYTNEKPAGTYHSCRFLRLYFLWGSLTDIRSDNIALY